MKYNRMISITLTVLMIAFLLIPTFSLAKYSPSDFEGKITTSADEQKNVKEVGGKIVGLIQVVGTIASVGMLIVLGIKYMMGSAEERAEYKKTMLPYFIGAVLIFGASNLTQIVYTWAKEVGK